MPQTTTVVSLCLAHRDLLDAIGCLLGAPFALPLRAANLVAEIGVVGKNGA